jgi:hypothetical protein
MANRNGLLAPQATHGNPDLSYYALANGAALSTPTLVAPITLQGTASEGALAVPAKIEVPGTNHGDPDYVGAIKLVPGGNPAAPNGSAGIVVRATASETPSIAAGTTVEVGTDGEAPNRVLVAGPEGLSEVYNELYNPVIKGTAIGTSSSALPVPGGLGIGAFTATPTVTGAYMLQVNVNVRNTDSIPIDGIIEWTLTTSAGEVQFVSNTLKALSISKASDFNEINGQPGGLNEPIDYCFSDLCFLTEGVPVAFNIFTARKSAAGGGAWAIQNYQARLVQMC